MNESMDQITLSRDVALVLFELLSRMGKGSALRLLDSADQRALWALEGQLEKLLPEPFLPNYAEIVRAARERLTVDIEQPSTPRLVGYIDVDDTLVRSVGSKRIPISSVVQRVRELHSSGAHLYCWSAAGAAYASATAIELGIADCFVDFLAKPQVVVDDQQPSDWRTLACFHPNEISSMSVGEIEAAVRLVEGRIPRGSVVW
jgi:hypothetical protein